MTFEDSPGREMKQQRREGAAHRGTSYCTQLVGRQAVETAAKPKSVNKLCD